MIKINILKWVMMGVVTLVFGVSWYLVKGSEPDMTTMLFGFVNGWILCRIFYFFDRIDKEATNEQE